MKYDKWFSITENILIHLNKSDLIGRCKITRGVMQVENYSKVCSEISKIEQDGFIKKKDNFAVSFGSGHAYVYLWKHIDGSVFYVGSGTGNRCEYISRGYKFARELDKADCVIYIVANGLERNEAYTIERFVSGIMSLIDPISLVNSDNIIRESDAEEFLQESHEKLKEFDGKTIRELEDNMVQILIDRDFTYDDAILTREFFDENGRKFFSSRYNTNGRCEQTLE